MFYASYPIINQAQKGDDWDYRLSAVYIVAIMDFNFPENEASDSVLHHVKLVELENNKVFYDKLAFVYAEMPKFNKTIEELDTNIDKWLYVLKNISKLQELPEKLRNKIFMKFFDQAEIANYTKEEYWAYQESLKIYRDNKAVLKTAIEEGRKEGRKEGKLTLLSSMIEKGILSLKQAADEMNMTIPQFENEIKNLSLD